ncbi:MAG: CHASE2 domain-containing protein [Bacteroidetes bacterium]|jgi:CHASE2 domain-containing sensor protein|nr:CHASE2 domain-containing protein [Bacteroidota bacterium]
MINRIIQPHSLIITGLIFLFIWFLNLIRLNMHYIDPFNNGLKDYEITDIVYAYMEGQPLPAEETELPIVLVHTGDPDRAAIARLINRLGAAGAAAIGIDLFFDRLKEPKADSLLRQSLAQNPSVVLACELHGLSGDHEGFSSWVGVDAYFSEHAQLGYVNFPANRTKVIRLFSPWEPVAQDSIPAFATALLEAYRPNSTQALRRRGKAVESIHFARHAGDFVHHPQQRLLDSLSLDEVRQIVEGKIVLAGYVPMQGRGDPLKDRHYTPLNQSYGNKAIPDMYGLVIHANVITMVLNGQYINTLPKWLNWAILLVFCYLNVLLIHWIYDDFNEVFHGITRGLQIVEFILLFFLISFLFYKFRLDLDFGLGILALLLAYDIIMIYESLIRKRIPAIDRIPEEIPLKKRPTPIPEEEE